LATISHGLEYYPFKCRVGVRRCRGEMGEIKFGKGDIKRRLCKVNIEKN